MEGRERGKKGREERECIFQHPEARTKAKGER